MPSFAGTFVFGDYSCVWNSLAVGLYHGDDGAPAIMYRALAKAVNNTDAYGDMLLTKIFRGTSARFMGRLQEYKSQVIATAHPWGVLGTPGKVGRDMIDLAQALVLTARAGTPAAASPASLTAPKALLATDFDIRWVMGPVLKETAIEMDFYLDTGPVLFSQT